MDSETRKLTILHISDTHFKYNDDLTDSKFTAFFKCISRLAETEWEKEKSLPGAVIFSGDLAFSGQVEEYAIAETFFNRVLKEFKVDRERLFVIPGNHDVNWGRITPQQEKQIQEIRLDRPGEDLDRFFVDGDLLKPFMEKFCGYQAFSKGYLHKPFNEEEHHFVESVKVGELLIAVAGFNSAWLVTPHEGEQGEIRLQLLGLPPLEKTLPQLETADLKIALLHHPPHWLLQSTQSRVEWRLEQKADLILYGHQVKPSQRFHVGGMEKIYCYIQGGPLHNTGGWPSRFQLIEFEIRGGEKRVRILPYRYFENPDEKSWCLDTTLPGPETDPPGHYRKWITLGKIISSPDRISPELQKLIDELKFCEILRADKFSAPADKKEIVDFYCGSPLRWEIIYAKGDIRRSLEKHVLDEALQNSNDFRIISIVAEPGAGKSTLAWRVAYELFQQGNIVLQADNSDEKLWEKLPQLARHFGRKFYVLIDDIFQEREFVKDLRKLTESYALPVTILSTARRSEFNTGGIDKRIINRIDLKLDEREKNSLLERLDKSYEALDEDAQRDFRTTDLFLVLGMVLTKGQSFERIIQSMIESLMKEDERCHDSSSALSSAFRFVSFSYSYGVSIPEELLSNLHENRTLEGILDREQVRGILYEHPQAGRESRFVRVGHQVIAKEAIRLLKTRFGPLSERALYADLLERTDENDSVQRSYITHLTNAISTNAEEGTSILEGINAENAKVLILLDQSTISELGLWRTVFTRLKQTEGVRKCSDEILLRAPMTTLDCQIRVSEHQNQNDGKALPTMESWLKNNPDDGVILGRYIHLVNEVGDERQVNDAITKAEQWTPRHPEDTMVRQPYISLVKWKGPEEQAEALMTKTPLWLEEHPWAHQVYQTYIELVTEKCEQEDRIRRTMSEASSWLKDHEEDTNVSNVWTTYLKLVRDKGFLENENIARALREAESWMLKHGPNPIFKDYLALLKKVRKSSLDVAVDVALVKHLGYQSMDSLDLKKDAGQIGDFAKWLSYEKFFDEGEKVYERLLSIEDLWSGTKKDIYFGYGMIFLGQGMNRELAYKERIEKLIRAEKYYRETLKIHKGDMARAYLAICLWGQKRFEEAENEFRHVEWWARHYSNIGYSPGKLFSEIGKFFFEFAYYEEARYWFSRALTEEKMFANWWGSARAKIGIASDLKRQARIREARSFFAEALLELQNALKNRPSPFQLPASRDIPNQIEACKSEIAACDQMLKR